MACNSCHAQTYADGTEVDTAEYTPGLCRDCHIMDGDDVVLGKEVPQSICLGCHGMDVESYNPHGQDGAGLECADCHDNDATREFEETGKIWVGKWDEQKKSLWLREGVIPVPPDWPCRLKFDQVTYMGDPTDPVPDYPSQDPEQWTFIGDVPDVTQDFKDYVDPLTWKQMDKMDKLMKGYSSDVSKIDRVPKFECLGGEILRITPELERK